MSRAHSDAELRATLDAVKAAGGSRRKAAAALGVSESTLKTRLQVARQRGLDVPAPPSAVQYAAATPPTADAAPMQPRERLAMEDRIRELETELKAERRKAITDEEVQREIIGLASAPVTTPDWVAHADASRRGPGTPSLVISDVHWNEVVLASEMNGINEYNPAVQVRRLQHAFDETASLCFDHLVESQFPGIVVMLGGDMVSGDIHDELVETNAAESIPTVLDLAPHVTMGLRRLADRFGRVFAVTAFGNHGKQHRQYRFKRHAYQSYDWLLYNVIARSFQDSGDDRVKFFIPTGPDALFQIAGRRYLLTHGDNLGTRGGDGIIGALGPIRRGSLKVGSQYATMGLHFDTMVMGHWHQLITLDDVIVNGCGIGYNEYARFNRFRPEVPRYALWTTHQRHGITWTFPVNLEEPRSVEASSEWVSWSQAS